MNIKLIMSITTITLALIFYTVGVFSARKSKTLKKFHVIIFWLGLLCDATGTVLMSTMSKGSSLLSPHGITGALGIALMLLNAVWATIILSKKDEQKLHNFRRLSLLIWLIWLIPYGLGMVIGMAK